MSDLIDSPAEGQNAPEYTVAELSGAVKRTLEGAFGRVRVRGEIGRVFRARSGHLYYDLKDDSNVVACTTWKGQAARLSVQPEEGMEVIVTGRLSAFGAQSKYNLNVEDISVAGEGALMAMLERRKKALAAEGLFDAARKRPIPFLPNVIGVVTSPSGAVIRDILHRLRERFPSKVLVWPVAVQGERCAAEVANGVRGFNAGVAGLPKPDVIIVARGGGSLEDLWGFNEEIVARAVAESGIPVISAVGHETDTTLIDYVSDLRAPTPTAAAEMAVPVRAELAAGLASLGGRQAQAAQRAVELRAQRLRDLGRGLPRADALLSNQRQRLDVASDRLPQALTMFTQRRRVALSTAASGFGPSLLRYGLTRQGDRLARFSDRLPRGLTAAVAATRSALLTGRAGRFDLRPVVERQAKGAEALSRLSKSLEVANARRMEDRRAALDTLGRMLNTLSYEQTLKRGFAVLRDGDGAVVSSADGVRQAGVVEAQFAGDDRINLYPADDAQNPVPSKPRKKPPAKPKKAPPSQGSLF